MHYTGNRLFFKKKKELQKNKTTSTNKFTIILSFSVELLAYSILIFNYHITFVSKINLVNLKVTDVQELKKHIKYHP